MADESRQNLLSPSATLDLDDVTPVARRIVSNRLKDLALLLSVGINVLLAFLYFGSTESKIGKRLSPYGSRCLAFLNFILIISQFHHSWSV